MRSETNKFLIKLAALSLPVLFWSVWQCCLPLNQYTFRGWEALISGKGWNAGFYPDQNLQMQEVGDLAPYTLDAVAHPVLWQTDAEGYRNHLPLCKDPEIAIIGDSFAMGASLSQEDTITQQLERDTGKCVRSFAGGKLHASARQVFADGLNPRYLVVILAERNTGVLHELVPFNENKRIEWLNYLPTSLLVRWSHFRKGFYSSYRARHGIMAALTRSFIGPEDAVSLYAPRTLDALAPAPRIKFFGNIGNSEDGPERLRSLSNILSHFAQQIGVHGTRLMVTFVPNKESIYYQDAGLPESKLGLNLKTALQSKDYLYFDLISRFKEEYQTHHQYLHHTDDTHWNEKGVKLLSEMIASEVTAKQ